jgi:hypothetical protein
MVRGGPGHAVGNCQPTTPNPSYQFDYLGETTEGNLHFVQRLKRAGVVNLFGLESLADVATTDLEQLQGAVQEVLDCLDVSHNSPDRAVYCSRTLNLRSIKCIGYDLDYVRGGARGVGFTCAPFPELGHTRRCPTVIPLHTPLPPRPSSTMTSRRGRGARTSTAWRR